MRASPSDALWPLGPEGPCEAVGVQIMRAVGWGLWGALVGAVGMLAYRRLVGAIHQPLESAWLPGSVVGAWTIAFGANWFLELSGGAAGTGWSPETFPPSLTLETEESKQNLADLPIHLVKRIRHGILKVAVFLMALCLTLPGTSTKGLVALWGSFLVGWVVEGWLGRHPRRRLGFLEAVCVAGRCTGPDPQVSGWEGEAFPADKRDSASWPEELLGHFQRRRTSQGKQIYQGELRVEFGRRQRTAVVHIAFCPPFPHKPVVFLCQQAGPPVRFKSTHLYPYGVRLELKREAIGVEEPAWVLLGFQAQCDAVAGKENPSG